MEGGTPNNGGGVDAGLCTEETPWNCDDSGLYEEEEEAVFPWKWVGLGAAVLIGGYVLYTKPWK